jgi:hypothetical protein
VQQASAEALKELCERRFEEVDLLIIYLDGKHFGGHQGICAERIAPATGLSLGSIELALYSHSGTPTGICGLQIPGLALALWDIPPHGKSLRAQCRRRSRFSLETPSKTEP